MRKKIILLFYLFLCGMIFGEEHRVDEIQYKINGSTQKKKVAEILDIDTDRNFGSEKEINLYLETRFLDLLSRGYFIESDAKSEKASKYTYTRREEGEGVFLYDVVFQVSDRWTIYPIIFPYYDSNDGFGFKSQFRWDNFLGTFGQLKIKYDYLKYNEKDADRDEVPDEYDNKGSVHFPSIELWDIPIGPVTFDAIGSMTYRSAFSAPFNILFSGLLNTETVIAKDVNLIIAGDIKKEKDADIDAGHDIGVSFFIGDFKNTILWRQRYWRYEDETERDTFNAFYSSLIHRGSITLFDDIEWGKATYTTNFESTLGYGSNDLDIDLTFNHTLGVNNERMIRNFKEGYSLTVENGITGYLQDHFDESEKLKLTFKPTIRLSTIYSFVNFKGRAQLPLSWEGSDTNNVAGGEYIRGVRDGREDFMGNWGGFLNMDIVFRVFDNDNVGQVDVVPFLDFGWIATNSSLSLESMRYGSGIELIWYFRSLKIRFSNAFDITENHSGMRDPYMFEMALKTELFY